MAYYITRTSTIDPKGAKVEISEKLWLQIGHMIAEEIKTGRAHVVKENVKERKK